MIGFGLGVLRLSPDDLWRLTPREIAAAARGLDGRRQRPIGRTGLDALMRLHPDRSDGD